jgi:hypothetical protein
VVTPGGGEDGYEIIENYVAGLPLLPPHVRSLIISGPEMPESQRRRLRHACLHNPQVNFLEFTDDLMSYLVMKNCATSHRKARPERHLHNARKRFRPAAITFCAAVGANANGTKTNAIWSSIAARSAQAITGILTA